MNNYELINDMVEIIKEQFKDEIKSGYRDENDDIREYAYYQELIIDELMDLYEYNTDISYQRDFVNYSPVPGWNEVYAGFYEILDGVEKILGTREWCSWRYILSSKEVRNIEIWMRGGVVPWIG